MDLYIRLRDGLPVDHPIFGDNFTQVFPHVDTGNLPPEFAKFIRVPPPVIGVYEVYEGVSYEWSGAVVTDVHHVRPMTESEKSAKQNAARDAWLQNGGYPSWSFDEETCSFMPPVPYPDDEKSYVWDESSQSWVEDVDVY